MAASCGIGAFRPSRGPLAASPLPGSYDLKSADQQGRLMQHRTRDLLLRQQTQVINALRAHLAELGIVAAQGGRGSRGGWCAMVRPGTV
jgi:transposase